VIATTPDPPYTAVIFTSLRTAVDEPGYRETAARMEDLAAEQPGYLGMESVRDNDTGLGITVSYWVTEADGLAWKQVAEHVAAQDLGIRTWYEQYRVRVATVTRSYGRERPERTS
jgi:heme-degrading monooxygenase HmoA